MAPGWIVDNGRSMKSYARDNRAINDRAVNGTWRVYLCGNEQDMRISIGSDHAGYELKRRLVERLEKAGWTVTDRGTNSGDSVDYPDHAHAVAADVQEGRSPFGVLICGSGNGVNITANKHHGVRSALAWTPEVARLAREHNDANVLALPARFISEEEAEGILDAFLGAHFEGGRHARRVEKIEPAATN